MLALSIAFTCLYVLLAYALQRSALHGPDSLPLFTEVWLAGACALLWGGWWLLGRWRSRARYLVLVIGGVLLGSVALDLGNIAESHDTSVREEEMAGVRVSAVRDAMYSTAKGDPIGIRLSFDVEFPTRDFYVVYPFLKPPEGTFDGESGDSGGQLPAGELERAPLDMRVIDRRIEPFPRQENRGDEAASKDPTSGLTFRPGVRYRFAFDLAPSWIRRPAAGAGLCIAWPGRNNWWSTRAAFDALIRVDHPTRYQVTINGTRYGNALEGGEPRLTTGTYNPKAFYDSAMSEKLPACGPGMVVVY